MPAPATTVESSVQERLARVESHVEHIQFDVTELKAKVERLDEKLEAKFGMLDAKIDAKIGALDAKIDAKIGALDAKFDAKLDKLADVVAALALNTERSFSRLTRWGLFLYFGLGASLLGTMAHGFKWL